MWKMGSGVVMGCAAAFLRLPEQVDKSSLACKICDWQAAHSVSAGLPCPSAPHKPNHVLGFLYCPPPCHGLHPSLHTHCAQPCPSLDKPFGISVHPLPQLLPSLCISEQAFRTQMRTSSQPLFPLRTWLSPTRTRTSSELLSPQRTSLSLRLVMCEPPSHWCVSNQSVSTNASCRKSHRLRDDGHEHPHPSFHTPKAATSAVSSGMMLCHTSAVRQARNMHQASGLVPRTREIK